MSNNPNIVQNATSISSVATANNLNYSFNSNLNNNNNNQDFNESVNRALDQTKDNINRSIDESKNQIPHYNNIVNSYQEQTFTSCKRNIRELYRISKVNYKLYSISMETISTKY